MDSTQEYPFGSGLAALLISLVALLFAASRLIQRKSPYPLPPGPPGEPILGHIRTVPTERPELYYEKLSKEYGKASFVVERESRNADPSFSADTDILYFKQLQTPVIVLNTVKVAEELLSKRGANYSDRPRFVLFEVFVDSLQGQGYEADTNT